MKDHTTYALRKDFVPVSDGRGALTTQQIGLVPGAEVPVLTLELPTGLRGQAREQVARRQLRDRLSLDAATTQMRPFFAPGGGDAWSHVLIVDTERLTRWKETVGPQCRALLPDYLALPTSADVWTIMANEDSVLARLGPGDGFGAQTELAPDLLRTKLERTDPLPGALLCIGEVPASMIALAKSYDITVVSETDTVLTLGLTEPRVLAHGELDFDLRRDPQLARTRLRRRVLPWRWPVLFGIVAAGLWSTAQIIETRRVTEDTATLNSNTNALVRAHFVPDGPLLDVRIQVSQVLAERRLAAEGWREDISALDLFATAAGAVNEAGAQIDEVSMVSQDEVSLRLTMTDFASVDRLAAHLQETGLNVEVVESRVGDGSAKVRTELRLAAPEEVSE